ncbi:MAG: signal peptidase II [Phycisphaerales bacterium]|nr:signal peptidase II [Phycisphaerales bacterium]
MSTSQAHPDPGRPARRSAFAWATVLLVLIVGLWADLATKSWSFETVASDPIELRYDDVVSGGFTIPWHEGERVLPMDLLDFHLVLNRGAVFGIGQGRRVVFVVFTVIAVGVAFAVFGWWTQARSHLAHIAIGLILAGGLGNLYDRVTIGAVRDFLHMLPRWELPFGLAWPGGTTEVFPWVFNVADVLLLAGMGLLLIQVHLADRQQARERAELEGSSSGSNLAD